MPEFTDLPEVPISGSPDPTPASPFMPFSPWSPIPDYPGPIPYYPPQQPVAPIYTCPDGSVPSSIDALVACTGGGPQSSPGEAIIPIALALSPSGLLAGAKKLRELVTKYPATKAALLKVFKAQVAKLAPGARAAASARLAQAEKIAQGAAKEGSRFLSDGRQKLLKSIEIYTETMKRQGFSAAKGALQTTATGVKTLARDSLGIGAATYIAGYLGDQYAKPTTRRQGLSPAGITPNTLDFFTPTVRRIESGNGNAPRGPTVPAANVIRAPSSTRGLAYFTPTVQRVALGDAIARAEARFGGGASALGLSLPAAPALPERLTPPGRTFGSVTIAPARPKPASNDRSWLGSALSSLGQAAAGQALRGLTPFVAQGVSSLPIAASPTTFGNPLNNVDPIAGTVARYSPIPPRGSTKTCECDKPKKPKQKKRRDVCYRGTYEERADGLTKRKKEKIPCQ